MNLYSIRINGVRMAMPFDIYRKTGWDDTIAQPLKLICYGMKIDGMQDTDEVIRLRQERSDAYLNKDK